MMNIKGDYSINQRRYKNGANIVFDSPKYNSIDLDLDRKKVGSESKSKLRHLFENKNGLPKITEEKTLDKSKVISKRVHNAVEGGKENLPDQAGTSFDQKYDEKSMHLKITDSIQSNEDENKEDSTSSPEDGGSEGVVSFSYDARGGGSSIGSVREFSVKTKMNRDSIQSSSARKRRLDTSPALSSNYRIKKSRQNLMRFDNAVFPEHSDSKDSICAESKPTKIPSSFHMNFVSASNNHLNQNMTGKFSKI